MFVPQLPIINDINNRVLSSRGAMPLKNNSTSDGTGDFAHGRENYRRGIDLNPATNTINPNATGIGQSRNGAFGGVANMFFSQSARSSILPSEAPRYQQQKKWIGGNRDASNIAAKRRINNIGVGSLNAAQTRMNFASGFDANIHREALVRTRNSGSVVCKKVQFRRRPGVN